MGFEHAEFWGVYQVYDVKHKDPNLKFLQNHRPKKNYNNLTRAKFLDCNFSSFRHPGELLCLVLIMLNSGSLSVEG